MSENRIAEIEQAPAVRKEVRLPEQMVHRLNMHIANCAMAVKGRDGFIEAAKLSLGVPDDWQTDLKRGVFVPPQGPQNGAEES